MSNTWQEVMEYFMGKTIGDIWPIDKHPITVRTTQTLAECFKLLEDNMILSVPVVGSPPSSTGKNDEEYFLGMIDTTDIVMFILATINPNSVLGGSPSPSVADFQKNLPAIQAEFERITVEQMLEKSNQWKKERQEDVFPEYYRKSDPLFEMIGMFAIGLHRIPILSEDSELSPSAAEEEEKNKENENSQNVENGKPKRSTGIKGKRKLVNVVTQSDLLAVLGQCLPLFGSSLQTRTMKDMHLFDKPLTTAPATRPVIEVLGLMRSDSPIITAIPVIEAEGGKENTLLATFSSSNLKGLHQSNWKDLGLGCLEFLQKQYEKTKDKPFPISIQSRKSLSPIICTQDDSLETVIMRMITTRVHRLWCVESQDSNKLIGVVSMSDIFQILMPAELFQSCFII